MSETEWEKLRRDLLKKFDEDTVQQALLALLEEQAKGVAILNPLHWCLMRASSRRKDEVKHLIREREVKEALTAFKVPYGTLSRQDKDRIRKRRSRKAA